MVPFSYIVLCIASLLGFSSETLFMWPSPILTKLNSSDPEENPLGRRITENEESWLSSVLYLGGALGPLPLCYISVKYGRKLALLLISLLHISAFLTLAFAASFPWYCIVRAVNGIALGSSYAILPVYLSEISEDSNRGAFTTIMQIFCELGALVMVSVGPYTSFPLLHIILSMFPFVFFILFAILAPESPYFLLRKGRVEDAKKSLTKLGTKPDRIEDRLKKMGEFEDVENWRTLFGSTAFRKGILISVLLRLGQELTGLAAVLAYSNIIFIQAGVTNISPSIGTIILAAIIFLCTLIVPFFVDSFGRRFVLIVVTFGATTSNFCLGLFFYLKSCTNIDVTVVSWLPILCLGSLLAFWALGFNSVPHTVCAEMFQTGIRPIISGCMSSVNWISAFFSAYYFSEMNSSWGEHTTFWCYAGYSLFTFLFIVFFVPETKQKSFAEIQNILAK